MANTASKKTTTKADPFIEHAMKVAEAQDRVSELQDAVDDARQNVRAIRGRIGAGDPDVTPADLAEAVAGVEFATLAQHGARSRLYQLYKAAPFRPVVAERVAEVLTEAFGFEFRAVENVPAERSDGSAPVAYVVQTAAADRSWSGPGNRDTATLSAPVSITLHRHGVTWVKPLDHRAILDALTDAGLSPRKSGLYEGETLSITGQTVGLDMPADEVKPSMVKVDAGPSPQAPRLVFNIEEPTGNGDMYR